MLVRELDTASWKALRALRLQALTNDPAQFLAVAEEATGWDERRWRAECVDGRWWVAAVHGLDVALSRVRDYPDEDPRLHIEGLWVAPGHRRSGVARRLVLHVEAVLAAEGHATVGLWLFDGNLPAAHLYRDLGYRPTLRCGSLPDGRIERELRRELAPPERLP